MDAPRADPLTLPSMDTADAGAEMDTSDSITTGEKERAPRKLSGSPAAGFDDVPPMLLKRTRFQVRIAMLAALDWVLVTGRMPRSWGRSRMRLIWKKGSDKSLPESCRPITATSAALYGLFCHILRGASKYGQRESSGSCKMGSGQGAAWRTACSSPRQWR